MKFIWIDEALAVSADAWEYLDVAKNHQVGHFFGFQFYTYSLRRTKHWRGKKFNYRRKA